MNDSQIKDILKEIKLEQHTSPFKKDEELTGYIKDGIYDINDIVGNEIDYEEDLKARSLLKNYVLYADYKNLAEFREIYGDEYAYLQAKYYKDANIQ